MTPFVSNVQILFHAVYFPLKVETKVVSKIKNAANETQTLHYK